MTEVRKFVQHYGRRPARSLSLGKKLHLALKRQGGDNAAERKELLKIVAGAPQAWKRTVSKLQHVSRRAAQGKVVKTTFTRDQRQFVRGKQKTRSGKKLAATPITRALLVAAGKRKTRTATSWNQPCKYWLCRNHKSYTQNGVPSYWLI